MTASRRPRGRPGHSRDDVLRHAIDVFNRRGYDATSVADIAKDLGMTKSAVFHHFATKDAILAAALDEALGELEQLVLTPLVTDTTSNAYGRLAVRLEASVRILIEHRPAVTLLLRVRGNSPVEQLALQRRRVIDERLAALVDEAAKQGHLRKDIEPEIMTRLMFGTINSLVDWYRDGGGLDAAAMAKMVTTLFSDGLRGDR